MDDVMHGEYKYYKKGVLKYSCNYVYGLIEGEYKKFNQNGDIESIKTYQNGKVVSEPSSKRVCPNNDEEVDEEVNQESTDEDDEE